VPIRPTASDPKTHLRLPGPSLSPPRDYWEKLGKDAVNYAARAVRIDDPALGGDLDDAAAELLHHSYCRLRTILPNTRLVLGADPAALSRAAMPTAVRLPVDALYLDTEARPRLLVEALALAPGGLELLVPEAGR
jgi:hypothetical protein